MLRKVPQGLGYMVVSQNKTKKHCGPSFSWEHHWKHHPEELTFSLTTMEGATIGIASRFSSASILSRGKDWYVSSTSSKESKSSCHHNHSVTTENTNDKPLRICWGVPSELSMCQSLTSSLGRTVRICHKSNKEGSVVIICLMSRVNVKLIAAIMRWINTRNRLICRYESSCRSHCSTLKRCVCINEGQEQHHTPDYVQHNPQPDLSHPPPHRERVRHCPINAILIPTLWCAIYADWLTPQGGSVHKNGINQSKSKLA